MSFIPEKEFTAQYEFIPVPGAGPLTLGTVRPISQKADSSWVSLACSVPSSFLSLGASVAEAATFQHVGPDDCRAHDSTPIACYYDPDIGVYVCYYAHAVNLAEVEFNECGGNCRNAGWAAVDAVGWTVRDRSRQNLCEGDNMCSDPATGSSFDGGCGWHSVAGCQQYANCTNPSTVLPCNEVGAPPDPQNGVDYCTSSQWYCHVIHGGTYTVGAVQDEFNDGHVDTDTLAYNGYLDAAGLVINGWVPDMSTKGSLGVYWTAPSVGGCTFQCGVPGCTLGWNNKHASSNGPMEYRSSAQVAVRPACEYRPSDPGNWSDVGNVCNGGNHFWSRASVSAIFTAKANNTGWKAHINNIDGTTMDSSVQQDNNIKKFATLTLPNGKAGLFRIGTDNAVAYRYYNGSSWGSWQSLASGSTLDIAAVAWPNGQADVFRVAGDGCNVYYSHSTDGQTWGGWNWWSPCGAPFAAADQIAAATMPDSTAWVAIHVPSTNTIRQTYYNGAGWSTWSDPPVPPGTPLNVKAINLLAYVPPVCCAKLTFLAVGTDNSSIYYRNWDGANWTAWTLWTTGYKKVSSFTTSDGGAYVLFIGTGSNNYLYTERFIGTSWDIIRQQGTKTWNSAVGVEVVRKGQ